MDLLEFYYDNPPKNEHYIERKLQLSNKQYINLCGARGCGKSAFILDYIANSKKNILYIDLEDPKLLMQTYETLPIDEFIKEFDIQEIVLDHYTDELDLELPQVAKLIIVSRIPTTSQHFSIQRLFPLDYEEFLAFEHNSNETTAFNHFLKVGTLPLSALYQKSLSLNLKLFFQHQFIENEQSLMLILAKYNTQPLTTHQIYTYTKEYFRISKDYVYKILKQFQEEGIIYLIDNAIKRSGKKLIVYDFALAKYLSTQHSFNTNFDALIAMSLIKHQKEFKTLGVYGYVTTNNELIIPAPFESEESIWVKSQNLYSKYTQYHISKVTILTVANNFEFIIGKLSFEAIPYTEWSIMDDEA